MDKEVLVEFTRTVLIGLVKITAYVGVIITMIMMLQYIGFAGNDSVMIGTLSVAIAMLGYFTLEMTWSRAKSKVEFRRKHGEEL